jgi:hypothetical protein
LRCFGFLKQRRQQHQPQGPSRKPGAQGDWSRKHATSKKVLLFCGYKLFHVEQFAFFFAPGESAGSSGQGEVFFRCRARRERVVRFMAQTPRCGMLDEIAAAPWKYLSFQGDLAPTKVP